MRLVALLPAALIAAGAATAAQAAPIGPVSEISISIGPELRDKADTYGEREFGYLARDLRRSVEASLGRAGALAETGGGRLELTIVGAIPNRPTLEQLSDKPGLSMLSYGVGGAEVEGAYIAPDGTSTPLHYRWYDNDIRWAWSSSTWSDAERAFDRFAVRLTRGPTLAER
jgi:hypothetical protein